MEGLFRLAVAAHFVHAGQVGGAEHMLYNLLRGIWQARGPNETALEILVSDPARLDRHFLTEIAGQGARVRLTTAGGPGPRFLAEQRAVLSNVKADATLFPNYYVPPLLPRSLGRIVCILHDMQYRHFSMNFSTRKRAWLRIAHALTIRRCDRLIVISEFVRQDALRFLGREFEHKISVVPNPISWDRFGTGPIIPGPPRILTVAAHYAHKNLPTLIRAFALVAKRWPDATLVLCGQDYAGLRGVSGQGGSLSGLAESLGIGGQVEITGYLDDHALGNQFRRATMFAFPSIFEGFGMPPVEALGFGLPTLITGRTALPEVTLGLAHTVIDPHSPIEWAAKLAAMLADPVAYRPDPAGVTRLRAQYAPSRIARLHLAACRDLRASVRAMPSRISRPGPSLDPDPDRGPHPATVSAPLTATAIHQASGSASIR